MPGSFPPSALSWASVCRSTEVFLRASLSTAGVAHPSRPGYRQTRCSATIPCRLGKPSSTRTRRWSRPSNRLTSWLTSAGVSSWMPRTLVWLSTLPPSTMMTAHGPRSISTRTTGLSLVVVASWAASGSVSMSTLTRLMPDSPPDCC